MFESWLELEHRPFGAAPFAAHFFPSEGIEFARSSIHRCVERGTGPAIVIGPAGTGKSMLAMVLQHELCPLTPFALVSGGELHSRREMLQSLLYEFGLPFRGDQESELRLTLLDFFTSRDASQLASVLVVDDAHCLSAELLHDLANLSSHARDGNWCLQLVLLGTIRLEELLATPSLASFQQRIASRSYLTPWTYPETTAYIHGQLAPLHEKWSQFPTFPDASFHKIYEITSGTPRLVNQLCEHVLMTVLVTGEKTVRPEEIERAWYDLQQLPPPAEFKTKTPNQRARNANEQELIEFGELTDDDNVPTTPYQVRDIQSKLEQLEDGLHFMAHGEPAHVEVQSAKTIKMEWPTVTAENPFAERFAEEVIVRDSANVPLIVLVPTPPHPAAAVHHAELADPNVHIRQNTNSEFISEFQSEFRSEASPVVTFVDASDVLSHNHVHQNAFVDAASFVPEESELLQWEHPIERGTERPSNRRYRDLFSRLSQGA